MKKYLYAGIMLALSIAPAAALPTYKIAAPTNAAPVIFRSNADGSTTDIPPASGNSDYQQFLLDWAAGAPVTIGATLQTATSPDPYSPANVQALGLVAP